MERRPQWKPLAGCSTDSYAFVVEGYSRLILAIAEELDRMENRLIEKGERNKALFEFPNSRHKSTLLIWSDDYGYAMAEVRPVLKNDGAIDRYRERNRWHLEDDELVHWSFAAPDAYMSSLHTGNQSDCLEAAKRIAEFLIIHGVSSVEHATISRSKNVDARFGAKKPI